MFSSLTNKIFENLPALRNRNFLLYWVGIFSYYLAARMEEVARGWLVYEMTKSVFLLGVAAASRLLPALFVTIIGGVAADRMKKRKLLFIVQAVLGVTSLLFASLTFSGVIEYWHIVALMIVWGAASHFAMPARLALVSELTRKEEFMNAYALYYVAFNFMRIVGPLIAGFLVGFIGIAGVYFTMVGCQFLLNVLLPATKVLKPAPSPQKSSIREELVNLYIYSRNNYIFFSLMGIGLAFVCCIFPSTSFMPVFAKDVLSVGPVGLGLLMSSLGIGYMVGSILVISLSNYRRKTLLLLCTGLVQGSFWFLFSRSTNFYLSIFILIAIGGVGGVYHTINSSLYQLSSTDEMRSRVTSLYTTIYGMSPIGLFFMGILADTMGAPIAVGAFGLFFAFFCGIIIILHPKFRRLSL